MLTELLAHPQFRVLQRTGTRVWNAYYTSEVTGQVCFGAGDTAEAALQMARDAATGVAVPAFENEDLF